jgi:hypothetical protein
MSFGPTAAARVQRAIASQTLLCTRARCMCIQRSTYHNSPWYVARYYKKKAALFVCSQGHLNQR